MSNKFCPNKNTDDFKRMSAVLGDSYATAAWYENNGNPIWLDSDGNPSKLWAELLEYPGVSNENTAMELKLRLYTKSYKQHKITNGLIGEPSARELVRWINERNARQATVALYKEYNLVDKKDANKPIKWSKTDANYKKVLGIAQKINSGSRATAKIIDVPSGGKTYLTILLTPKAAFTTEEGEQVAFYDPKTGEITFTDKGLSAETVIHEFAHPFVDALEKNNPELFKNLVNDIRKDAKVPEIKKIIDHVDTHYSKAGEQIKEKELLAYTLSEYGRGNIDPNTGKNTKSAIKRFYAWLTSIAKDLMDQMRSKKTLYVDQIHPKTKYNELADLFTVYTELGDINLGTTPQTTKEKISPEATKEETDAAKKAAIKAKIAARKKSKKNPPAHKMIQTKDADFIEIKDEAAHMSSLIPKEIATSLTPGYIRVLSGGKAVVGMFKDGMIHLSERGPRGTAYHEGFHAVFRTLLDSKEQAGVLAEARKFNTAPTAKDLFDLELQLGVTEQEAEKIYYEEILADQFAEFMDAPTRRTFPEKIRGFFRQLGDWLTRVFTRQSAVDKLFNNIKTGKYQKQTPNITRSVAYRVHEVFDVHEVNRITRELTSIAFENVNTIEDLKATPVQLSTIEDHILDAFETAEEAGNEALVDNLTALFDETGESIDVFWLREIDSYLRNSLGLSAKISQKVTEEDTDEMNIEDLEKSNFLKSSYEVSGKTNATAAVKFMVAMTQQVTNTAPHSPATMETMQTQISPLTGLPVLVDFGMLYNDVENALANIVPRKVDGVMQDGLELMLNELKSQAKYKPEMFVLADKIENASEEIRTQFFSAFSKQKGSFVHHQIEGSARDKNINSKFTSSNFSTKANVIRDTWVTNFNKAFGMIQEKELVYNPERIVRFLDARDKLTERVSDEVALAEAGEGKLSDGSKAQFRTLLGFMGINISPFTIDYIIESRIKEGYELSYDAEYAQQFENLLYDFVRATNDLKDRKGTVYGKNNQIQDNSRFFKGVLAEAEAYFKMIPGENAFVGPDGNQIYSFQHNDLTSKAVNAFKAGDLTHLDLIRNSAYGKNSVWVNELLDPINGTGNREAFGMHMYGNLKSEETVGDKGAKASELKSIDSYMDNVNKTLSGYYIGLAEADKSRQTYFKGPKFRRSGLTLNREGKPTIINPEGTKILKGYLADELSRMRVAHAVVHGTESANPAPEKDWVLFYHYYPVAPGTGIIGEKLDKVPGNAFNSYLFPSIDLVKFGLQSPDGEILALSPSNFDNNKALTSYIQNEFYKLVVDEMARATKLGLLEETKTGELMPRLISQSIINDPNRKYTQGGAIDTLQMMGDYVLNSIIGSVEQTKLFNGDPAIYKVKGVGKKAWKDLDHFGDFKKRIPAVYASGGDFRIFNNKDGTPVVRPSYTSATIANITVPSAFFGELTGVPEGAETEHFDNKIEAVSWYNRLIKTEEFREQYVIIGPEEGPFETFKATVEDGESKVKLELIKTSVGFNRENMAEVQKITGLPMEELEELFKPYLEINQTDAQAWITLDAYKERMQGLGKWTTAHETAYQQSVAGEAMSSENVKLLAQPLKTVHAELVPTKNGEMIMNYNKQSEAVLLPFMKDMELGNMMKAMERDGIDHVIVLDGKKAGAQGIVDVTDGKGKILDAKDIKMNPINLSYNNLFLQQDLPAKGIKDTLVGSQGTKNVLSVVNLKGKYFHDKTGQEVVDIFHETIGRLSDAGLVSLDKSIGYNEEANDFSLDDKGRSKIHKIVQKEFEGEISENHHQALEDNIAFDALPIKNKIMNKLLALTTKKTVKLKQSGGALIQLSDLGFLGTEQKLSDSVKNGIIWFKNPKERLNPMHVKGGEVKAAQILIPHGKLVKMLAQHYPEFKDMSHSEIKEKVGKDVLEGMSYRIPNQGPSSNDAFEIVGVLPPEMGDTMVAFSDITTKTGSDFDIDKAFVILPNFYFDKEAGKIKKVGYKIDDLANARPSELQNLRLDLMRQMLMHPDAYTAVMAPLDDPWLEDFAKGLFPEKNKLKSMEFFTGAYQMDVKNTFDGAKALVGSIANHMTHHSLALADGLYFTDYYLGKGIVDGGSSSISNVTAEDGSSVAGTLGGFMNAIVDAAKDPFIARANVNHYTAGTAFMLARTGVDRKWLTAFIGQPIIRDVVAAQDAQEGRFGKPVWDVEQGKYLSAIESVLMGYDLKGITESEFKSSEKYATMRKDEKSSIKTPLEELVKDIEQGDMDSAEFKSRQVKVLKQFLEWQGKASELNDVIKISKADVDGATKTLMSAQLAVNLLHKTLESKAIGNADKMLGIYRDINGALDIPQGDKSRMVGRYFNNSVLAALKRYSRYFIAGSKASNNMVEKVAKHAGYTELTTGSNIEDLVMKVSNEVYTHAASDTRAFKVEPERLKKLLYGQGKVAPGSDAVLSIADRVEAAKHTELKDNLLINGLQFKAGREGAPDKVSLPNTETVKDTKEALAQAWEELMSVDQQLGEDLILYSFYTTGFSTGVGSFAEHIPNSWLKAMGFHEDINTKNVEYDEIWALEDNVMDKIFKNLYKDNQLVPVAAKKSIKQIRWAEGGELMVNTDHAFALTQADSLNYVIPGEMGPHGKVFKRFVKREIPIINQFGDVTGKKYMLYKLAGYTHSSDAVYIRTNTLGVSGYGNNVKEYIGDGKTSIFDQNNVSLPEGLQKLSDVLEQRGTVTDASYNETQVPDFKESEPEDRLAFCIMK